MKNTIFLAVILAASGASLFGQCSASASGSTVAAAEINAKACATETFIAGSGGVTANTLVITDTSSPAKAIAATGAGAHGVALSTAIATASVQVQRYGQVACVMDNNATAGHLVIPGTSTVIDCRDSGFSGPTASASISTSTRIIGTLLTSASAGATAIVELSPAQFGTLINSVNSAAVPASQTCVGTNSSSQIVTATCGAAPFAAISSFSFAIRTIYQNTSGAPQTVAGGGFCSSSQVMAVLAGAASPPTVSVNTNWFQIVGGFNQEIVGIIPNGYFYEFVEAGGGTTNCTINGGSITQ
jgi:hypothetical protein